MQELGHESLDRLRRSIWRTCGVKTRSKKAVADADFVPKPSFGEWHERRLGYRPPGPEIGKKKTLGCSLWCYLEKHQQEIKKAAALTEPARGGFAIRNLRSGMRSSCEASVFDHR